MRAAMKKQSPLILYSLFTFLFSLFASSQALAKKIEAVMHNFEMKQFPHRRFNLLNPRVTKFNHLAAFNADQMIMLLKAIRFLVLRKIFSKLMFGDQFTMEQEFKCIIDCCPADAIVGILHVEVKRFRIEVIGTAIDLFQDGVTFRRAAQVVKFEMPGENIFYFFKRSSMGKSSQ
jgi:hypothetical protein